LPARPASTHILTLLTPQAALEKRFGKFMNYTRTAQGTLQWEEDAAQVLMNSGSFMRASYPERPSQVVFTLRPGSSGK